MWFDEPMPRSIELGEDATDFNLPDCTYGLLGTEIQGAEIVKLVWDPFNCSDMLQDFESNFIANFADLSYTFAATVNDVKQGSAFSARMEGENDVVSDGTNVAEHQVVSFRILPDLYYI